MKKQKGGGKAPAGAIKSRAYDRGDKIAGYIFVLPFIIGFVFLYADIIVNSIVLSFSSTTASPKGYVTEFAGLENYNYILFKNPDYNRTVITSITTLLTNVPIILIFSLFIATVLNQKMIGRGFFRMIFFIPVILSTGIVERADATNAMLSHMSAGIDTGTGFQTISFDQLYQQLQNLYLPSWLTTTLTGFINNIYGLVNMSGVQILLFIAALQSISPSIYESVEIEGASGWDCFWKITFPMLMPMMLVNAIYTVIDYFTQSSNQVMTMINNMIFKSSNLGQAASMSWLYFLLIIVVIGLLALLIFGIYKFTQKRPKAYI